MDNRGLTELELFHQSFFKAYRFTQELQTFLAARKHQFCKIKWHTLCLVVCDHKLWEAVSIEKTYTDF